MYVYGTVTLSSSTKFELVVVSTNEPSFVTSAVALGSAFVERPVITPALSVSVFFVISAFAASTPLARTVVPSGTNEYLALISSESVLSLIVSLTSLFFPAFLSVKVNVPVSVHVSVPTNASLVIVGRGVLIEASVLPSYTFVILVLDTEYLIVFLATVIGFDLTGAFELSYTKSTVLSFMAGVITVSAVTTVSPILTVIPAADNLSNDISVPVEPSSYVGVNLTVVSNLSPYV